MIDQPTPVMKRLPIISEKPDIDPTEKAKMIEFIQKECHMLKKKYAEDLYDSNYSNIETLEELKEYFETARQRREESNKKYREEEEIKKIKEIKEKKLQLQNIIKSSQVPKIFSDIRAKDFKLTDNNRETAKTAIQSITKNNGLFIYGECGTGKTMLACIIANERAELLKSSMFIRAVDIFHELNPFFSQNKSETIRKRNLVLTTPCLIIDDLGAEKPSDFTRAILFDILDFRMNEELQTVITTNFSIEELKKRINVKEELNLSDKIIRRITATCKLVELKHF